jgi:thiol-disulfide isomerase/thioredoxin
MPGVTTRRASSLLLVLLAACTRTDPEAAREAKAEPSPSGTQTPQLGAGPLVLAQGVRVARAPQGSDAARVVREARERESVDGRDLVVYVGAKWCEPCKHFHKAAEAGALDADFPRLTVLEFDLDEDRDRLVAAGYASQFIPLFVVPGADGRATNKRFEGSVKGGGAVANIAPRLRAILAR